MFGMGQNFLCLVPDNLNDIQVSLFLVALLSLFFNIIRYYHT